MGFGSDSMGCPVPFPGPVVVRFKWRGPGLSACLVPGTGFAPPSLYRSDWRWAVNVDSWLRHGRHVLCVVEPGHF